MKYEKHSYEVEQDKYPSFYTAEGRDQCCTTHFHRKIELLYVTKGTKNVVINNGKYSLRENNLCIVDSYSLHYYEPSPQGQQIIITLTTSSCERYFKYRHNKVLCGNIVDDPEFCTAHLLPYIRNLLNYQSNNAYYVNANVDMLLSEICNYIGLKNTVDSFEIENIDDILAYIEQNYAKELTLSSLATHFGYNKYYFSRLFNSIFHTNINDYLNLIRLEKTLQYHNENKCSITTAALNNGFNSMPTFYRILKKFTPPQDDNSKYNITNTDR